jgi:hypothetical protein
MALARVTLTQDFKQRVAQLVAKKNEAEQSFKGAIGAYLDFCREYFNLHREAKTSTAKAYLYKQTGLDEPTLRSTYQRIGEQVGVFRKHIALLPPSQESLKELARAEKKREGTIARLVKNGTLTPDVSVSEVRKLLRGRKRSSAHVSAAAPKAHRQYIVVLTSTNRSDLLVCVTELLKASESIIATVDGDKPLYEDGKATLGKWYGANETRFTLTKN